MFSSSDNFRCIGLFSYCVFCPHCHAFSPGLCLAHLTKVATFPTIHTFFVVGWASFPPYLQPRMVFPTIPTLWPFIGFNSGVIVSQYAWGAHSVFFLCNQLHECCWVLNFCRFAQHLLFYLVVYQALYQLAHDYCICEVIGMGASMGPACHVVST